MRGFYGQEPLLEQNLLDAFRKSWQQQVERQRYDISSVSDWKNVFNALNSFYFLSSLRLKCMATLNLMQMD